MGAFSTLLFGNGLGRALAPEYFPLDAGIRSVWNDEDELLTAESKRSIIQCLPDGDDGPVEMPSKEDELATLHRVVTACKLIGEVEREDPIWLTQHGRDFPRVIDHFIGRVAHYFHQCPTSTPEYLKCIEGVAWFVKNYYAHVATLNYDNLLYQPLIDAEVLAGYSGHLLDGFTGMTFDESSMARHRKELGWYLHLHGSPLFYDDNGSVKKLRQARLDESYATDNVLHRHIVLSHTKSKPEIISGSALLSSYWEFFGKALDESSRVVVFGYGGFDSHVNKRISDWITVRKKRREEVTVVVVERKDPTKERAARREFWKKKLDRNGSLADADLKLWRYANILDFDWKSLA